MPPMNFLADRNGGYARQADSLSYDTEEGDP